MGDGELVGDGEVEDAMEERDDSDEEEEDAEDKDDWACRRMVSIVTQGLGLSSRAAQETGKGEIIHTLLYRSPQLQPE